DAARDVDADFVQVRLFRFPLSLLHRKIRSGQRDLDEAAHFLEFFFLDPLERAEILHFAGNGAIKVSGIEVRDRANAADSSQQVFPAFLRADAYCADQSNARNDNSASQLSFTPVELRYPAASEPLLRFGVLINILDGIFHRGHLLGVLVRHFDAKRFFKRHHQFHLVERIGAQVIHEGRGRRHFRFIHTELLDDNLLYAFFYAGHSHFLRPDWVGTLSSYFYTGARTASARTLEESLF